MSYELLFIFFGIAWAGLALFVLSIMMGIRRLITPKPKVTNWERQLEAIEKLSLEEWAEMHGYMRIHCKKHGSSWSDGGICEYCDPEELEEENGTQSESDLGQI